MAIKLAAYKLRHNILAVLIACVSWIVFAHFVQGTVGKVWLDTIAYALLGWYWLGGVVVPWIERKLENLFEL
jgi:hypothetical protein